MKRAPLFYLALMGLAACSDGPGGSLAGPDAAAPLAAASPHAPTASPIPFAPEPGPFANVLALGDDATSGPLPIGFEFRFFGEAYDHFNVSSNGFIGFDEFMPNGCCSGRPIPEPDFIDNIIAVAWTDLFPPGGGTISWETRGTAPGRRLIVAFEGLGWFPEFGVNRVTAQAILHEGTNAIELHTANLSPGHIYTQGVENADGTVAAFLPGRVEADFGLENDAVRFTTGGPGKGRALGHARGHRGRIESVTGSGQLVVDGERRTFAFTALRMQDGSVRGEWQRISRQVPSKAHGNVTCLTIVGNRAWIGGVAERKAVPEGEVGWWVEDNGEGRRSPRDRSSLQWTGREPGFAEEWCASRFEDPANPLLEIDGGNIQVRG